MNFKRRTRILEVGDVLEMVEMLQTPCWKKQDESAACVGKIQH